ncbi:MAG: formate dehydrogenase subunit gamma [Rhodomicrobium sp.]
MGQGQAHIRVRRYSGSARINHWIVAISFVLLLVTGLSLFHPSLFAIGVTLFGSGQMVRFIHPWIGVVLAASFFLLFLRFFPANLPAFTDFVWVARLRSVIAGRDEYLPEVGKYNAGQKFVFWSQTVLVVILFVTGIGLWDSKLQFFEQLTGYYPTIDQRRWAAVIHASAAVLTIMVWIIHVYAALWVRGTIPAMTRGSVTGGWGWRHHRKWLRKQLKNPSQVEQSPSSNLKPAE